MKLDIQKGNYDPQYYSIVRFAAAICHSKTEIFCSYCICHKSLSIQLLISHKIKLIAKKHWGISSYLQLVFSEPSMNCDESFSTHSSDNDSGYCSPPPEPDLHPIRYCKKSIPKLNNPPTKSCIRPNYPNILKKTVTFSIPRQICLLVTYSTAANQVRRDRIYEFEGLRNELLKIVFPNED